MTDFLVTHGPYKAGTTRAGTALFNASWPVSTLRDRAYWFEFDADGNLIDTDVPQHDDGPAASALADDMKAYILDNIKPEWIP